MQLDPRSTSFGRHETFPLRYGWLPKGFEAIEEDPQTLHKPEIAMIKLGVGRNMVNAIQYWLQTTGIITIDGGGAHATELGKMIFAADYNGGDPYLEDDATLWIVHWLIASNATQATGFFWFFNRYAAPRFSDKELLEGLTDFVNNTLNQKKRSQNTLKSDISAITRMYAAVPGRTDEHLDSPLTDLGLIEADPHSGYRSLRTNRPFLPVTALHFALSQRFAAEPEQPALPVRSLLYGDDGKASPGAIFRLSESGFMEKLEQLMGTYPSCYELRDTAGVNQLYRGSELPDPLSILEHYYRSSL
ncbi:hypothetical protein HH1059_13270 [Halorhodospira halochloris]|uniref:DUF4007 domain-containing protein n=1 Tax=Halorhodospira halochloris TaxID=1052 RepID=A0A0X8X9P1_HALHR|nr:DUF4007 family protein [Halorhodospira halochloris]MBK1652113.1 hypothetical protein [Halorhodospira halochloris]BAU58036.1 hypothetical protein HH1059_13270 [Halorhodospira halochloris]